MDISRMGDIFWKKKNKDFNWDITILIQPFQKYDLKKNK